MQQVKEDVFAFRRGMGFGPGSPLVQTTECRNQVGACTYLSRETTALRVYIGYKKSAQSAKRDRDYVSPDFHFRHCGGWPMLVTFPLCLSSALFEPPDNHVSEDESDDRRSCNAHCYRYEEIK